jgi:hypothetical protein
MADSLLEGDQPSPEDRDTIFNKWKDKTKEEILDAKVNSDLFIKTKNAQFDDLKKDYLELRERQQASADLTVLLDQIKKERLNPDTTVITPKEPTQPAIKTEEIEALIRKTATETFSERERIRTQQDNFNTIQSKLKEQFGDNYQTTYKQRLDTLGLSKEFADELAKNHPTVFLKTFELDSQRQTSQSIAPPRTQQRQTSFAPAVTKRDWNYYQEMKKTNPKLYLDPKIANQMHDDAIALGADFGMPLD